ncbi:helix-turn-helix domain-containing protein [Daeguia caeni]|uniref:Helix-turn-helix domain-containing protein n=1 Tax=Daeguia caeni TaxID=439612 RepID=A0ABV9H6V1_9HYPH
MSLSAHTDIHIGNFVSDNTVRKDSISSYAFATEANGRFRSVTSEVGASTLDYDCNVAIILLDAVRNLRWQFGSNPETSGTCTQGTVFIIPKGTTTRFVWPEQIEYLIVNLDSQNAADRDVSFSSLSLDSTKLIRFTNRQCFQIGQMIDDELSEPFVDEAYLKALGSVLLGLIARNYQTSQSNGTHQSGLSNYACRQIENYLKENFCEPISVPQMAAMLGISAGHFATCFRESFGQTPHQYLLKLRLDEAERRLRETNTPISEIASDLSFSSQSHLTTALRKYRRLTPGEFRRRRGATSR